MNAAFAPQARRRRGCHRLRPARAVPRRHRLAAGADRAPGARALRRLPQGASSGASRTRCPTRSRRGSTGWSATAAGPSPSASARRARPGRAPSRVRPVPPLPLVRQDMTRDYVAALEARAPAAPAGGRPLVPRARGDRGAAQRAGRDRAARRRAGGVRDACADRCSRSPTPRCSRGASRSGAASVPAAPRRASPALAEVAEALALLRELHRGATAGRSPTPSRAARRHARPRRVRDLADRRPGARQRRPPDGPRAARRAARPGVVPRVRRPARGRRRSRRGGRGAAARGRRRGRAHHDRAQGQGARVPGGGPRRHDRKETRDRHAGPIRRAACAPSASPAARHPSCATTATRR